MMKKFFEEKKWLVLSILAIVVVAALVIGICVGVSGGEKEPNPTEGTSNVGATDPTGTTGGNGNDDVTDPTVTDPSGETEPPIGTPDNPIQPDNPNPPDDYVEPTEPDETVPDPTTPDIDPDDVPTVDPDIDGDGDENDEDLVTPPVTPPKPDADVDDDRFGGVTGATIRYTDWASWDHATRQAFYDAYADCDDPEIMHNILKATQYKDYECGFEGHACKTDGHHDALMEMVNAGCDYCGKHDCPSFFVLNENLFTVYDEHACPEYDKHKDPTVYCQTCGKPKGLGAGMCTHFLQSVNCDICGKWVEAHTCHTCYED